MKKNYLSLLVYVSLFFNYSLGFAQTYCSPSFGNPSQHYISRVQLNSIDQTSTYPSSGSYNNFTSNTTSLVIGQTYSITISTYRFEPWRTAGYGIWIDYNNDGDFDDTNETITTISATNTSPQTASFTIPAGITLGSKRLRINMVSWYIPGACQNDNANSGETEDYSVNIIQPVNPIASNDLLSVKKNSVAGVSNQINVASNDMVGSGAGSDGNDYSIASSPLTTANGGTVTEITDGVFQYVPTTNYMGSDTFTYTLCNASNICVTATVTVNVTLGACTPTSISSGVTYITNFRLYSGATNYINNTSGNNLGYGNFLNVTPPNLNLGANYSVDLDTFDSVNSALGWSLYLDLNQDGDFNDANERLYDSNGTIATPFAIQTITIPSVASTGKTVMRVGTRRYWSSNNPCGNTDGQPEEFEDYVVNLQIDPTSNADVGVLGNSNNIITGSTSVGFYNNTNFGVADLNSGLVTKTFIISNYGGQNLTLGTTPVSFQVGSNSSFVITSQPAANTILATGQTATFTISFNPTAVGVFTALVSISSNDVDENPFTFTIQGEGAQIYIDTDADGVNNNVDSDDDNDGITDTYEQLNCLSNTNATLAEVVFLNETFGAGNTRVRINEVYPGVTTTYCFEDGTTAQAEDECNTIVDLDDGKYTVHYSVANNDGVNQISPTGTDLSSWADQYWYNGQDHTPGDTYGRMAIFNASYDPGTFYETQITGAIANVPINYSFWALNINKGNSVFGGVNRIIPNVTVNFISTDRSITYGSYSTGDILRCNSDPTDECTVSVWKNYATSITIPSSDFIVQFVNNAPGGLGNDLALDDIKITQMLCDLDSDGVADVLDLDNDNDGIPNIYETLMVANPDPDRDGTSLGTNWIDANDNGLCDLYEGLTATDSDGDGVPNYLDLDSDNDSIFDCDEADNLGDIDVNGNGRGDGTDVATNVASTTSDGDGLLNIVDNNDSDNDSSDHGTSGYTPPLDSDSDGVPDYLDIYNNTTSTYDIDTTIYSSLDADNNGTIDGTDDADDDGILDVFDTNDVNLGSPRDINQKCSLYFDGRNDYIEETTSVLAGLSKATIMTFIKVDNSFSTKGVIVGEEKLNVVLNASRNVEINYNGATFVGTSTISKNVWTHIGIVLDAATSGNIKLYINGELTDTYTANSSIQSGNGLLRIGCSSTAIGADYFKGEIEELRIFNTALSEAQFRKIIYQEIKSSNFALGEIVPLTITGLNPSTLVRYYRMDTYKDDILDNLVSNTIDTSTGAKLYNIKKIYSQTAPLPYETTSDGSWDTSTVWKYGSVWDIPEKAWSIVTVKNNITANHSHETLGLLIDSNKTLSIQSNSAITNHWYLKLNGKIDLVGRSQLVQTSESELDVTSSGYIEREQDGVANLYNYNYWSSPVSTINTTSNNNDYTISGVMKDATDTSILKNINFITGLDGAPTSPISITSRWLYKFQNLSNVYANWTPINQNSNLPAGVGFTMKGVANLFSGERQNYAFVGKPNNGKITLAIASNNLNLCGNPYPSAIDSEQFILDNIIGGNPESSNATTGTIYFWEHAKENNTHLLSRYLGGYATLNLTGGLPPVTTALIDGVGTSSRIPNKYIPVGQGFFVKGNLSGGSIIFKNTQRGFKLETDNSATGSNILFRTHNQNQYKKIRLKFITVDGYQRQILLGFMENLANNEINHGFDAELFDDYPSDCFFKVSDKKLVIQGVGYFNDSESYPIDLKTNLDGVVKIKIEALENIGNQKIYIYDNVTGIYSEISNGNEFSIRLAVGEYNNRFSLRFKDVTLSNSSSELVTGIDLFYYKDTQEIYINCHLQLLKSVELFDLLGKRIAKKDNLNSIDYSISTHNLKTGVYILKGHTESASFTQKILVY